MILDNKQTMYKEYYAGKFGNQLYSWSSLDAYYDSSYEGRVVLRYKGKAGGAWCVYGLNRDEIPAVVEQWKSEGADPSLIVVNELAEDEALALQGEVMQSEKHISLRYSTLPMPMRKALAKEQHHVDGLVAVATLKAYLDPSSYDFLQELLDTYHGAVVEFSTYKKDIGNIPRRNTVFWEVRHY